MLIDTKIDDFELLCGRILLEFRGISQIWEAATAERMKIGRYYQPQRCKPLNFSTLCSLHRFAIDFFARGAHTRIAIARLHER